METTSIDHQVSDLAWCITCGLRAGYSLRQVIEQLASTAPEPAAGACRQLSAALEQGQDLEAALEGWKQRYPSGALERLAEVIASQQRAGGDLADALEALEQDLLRTSGSDPAFYPLMREEAAQLGAKVPERAREP